MQYELDQEGFDKLMQQKMHLTILPARNKYNERPQKCPECGARDAYIFGMEVISPRCLGDDKWICVRCEYVFLWGGSSDKPPPGITFKGIKFEC